MKNIFRILGYNIPTTMDLTHYGKPISSQDNIIWIRKKNSNNNYKITQSELTNKVELIQSSIGNDNVLISFTDTRSTSDPLNTFTRQVISPNNKVYKFVDGVKSK